LGTKNWVTYVSQSPPDGPGPVATDRWAIDVLEALARLREEAIRIRSVVE